jgi:hypothetical protein
MKAGYLALIAVMGWVGTGCAGARGNMRFDRLAYPASMSGYLRASDGQILPPTSLYRVANIKETHTFWGMCYSLAALNHSYDPCDAINRAVEAAHGDGIVNLRVSAKGCGWNYVPFLNLLPFWPGCTHVVIEGDIVTQESRKAQGTNPPLLAIPPPKDGGSP